MSIGDEDERYRAAMTIRAFMS
ncbi:hypothetical protein BDI4_10221 [Burkholderia diffusa]|nr:hypothetical protein BDI4_10221 [Burkholderia diffusa]